MIPQQIRQSIACAGE